MSDWECSSCTLLNKGTVDICPTCHLRNPNAVLTYPDNSGMDQNGATSALKYPGSDKSEFKHTGSDPTSDKGMFIKFVFFLIHFVIVSVIENLEETFNLQRPTVFLLFHLWNIYNIALAL